MPVLKLYENGTTAGVAPRFNGHTRARRANVGGWSHRSIRSNTAFLYSICEHGLSGHGLSVTLTVRDCPESPAEWQRMRNTFLQACARLGMIRVHWVTEWQRRRVPHLHGAMWFPEDRDGATVIRTIYKAWLSVADPYGALPHSQTVTSIHDAVGWFQYVSKHAARGLRHHQRSPEAIPLQWQSGTGRMWGHRGMWPRREPERVEMGMHAFWRFRRLVRQWRKAEARARGDARRIGQARRMLASSERAQSSVRGVSEWLGYEQTLQLVAVVGALGYAIKCSEDEAS